MSATEIVVDGETFCRVDTVSERLRIVVADNRGLTFVGRCEVPVGGEPWLLIRGARCVVRWGTSGHLAELAGSGPLGNTTFGKRRDVKVRTSAVVLVYDCNEEAWGDA